MEQYIEKDPGSRSSMIIAAFLDETDRWQVKIDALEAQRAKVVSATTDAVARLMREGRLKVWWYAKILKKETAAQIEIKRLFVEDAKICAEIDRVTKLKPNADIYEIALLEIFTPSGGRT